MKILIILSIALFAGLLLSRAVKLLKLPAVTAYLIAGVLIGPYCLGALGNYLTNLGNDFSWLGFIDSHSVESFNIISKVALGFIAFSIGNEFRLKDLKQIGTGASSSVILPLLRLRKE